MEIDFGCSYSREKALKEDKERKEDRLQVFIKEEKDNRPNIKPKRSENLQKKKQEENRVTKTEKEAERSEDQNKNEAEKMLTIWDLLVNVTEKEIKYMCRNIKEIQIARIKRSSNKALAVVKSDHLEEARAPWSLPMGDNKLVHVTWGDEDYKRREQQGQYSAKLMGLARGTSEVLLLRHVRNRGVKTIHIPENRNGNPRGTATVTFKIEEDLRAACRSPVRYNNYTLYWRTNDKEEETRIKEQEPKTSKHQELTYSTYEEGSTSKKVGTKEEEEEEKRSNKKGKKVIEEENKENTNSEYLLHRILDRLNDLENRLNKTEASAKGNFADRS